MTEKSDVPCVWCGRIYEDGPGIGGRRPRLRQAPHVTASSGLDSAASRFRSPDLPPLPCTGYGGSRLMGDRWLTVTCLPAAHQCGGDNG
jgi:hypothetical protein